ncbi:MAG: nucleotidyltransferase [Anaerolineaceae bacterium]|nr:nucleotidyltransferase [Anaerolineaceae bacterium]
MGGSGGGYLNRIPRDLNKLISVSEEETDESYHRTQVEEFLNNKLNDFNDHDYEAINAHRGEIERRLQSDYDDFETLLYGGSHSRYTDVRKLSDIDILAVLGDISNLPQSSNEAIASLASSLEQRFPKSKIETGAMAVTIHFTDGIEIQVLPAYRQGNEVFSIPNPTTSGWVRTCPANVATQLTNLNQRLSNNVVPVIKLAKAICYSQGIEVKSYHLENMALQAFSNYTGLQTHSQMLRHLFNQAKTLCLHVMSDPCGQSADVSGNLSSRERSKMARDFNSVETAIGDAMSTRSLDPWQRLFEK